MAITILLHCIYINITGLERKQYCLFGSSLCYIETRVIVFFCNTVNSGCLKFEVHPIQLIFQSIFSDPR